MQTMTGSQVYAPSVLEARQVRRGLGERASGERGLGERGLGDLAVRLSGVGPGRAARTPIDADLAGLAVVGVAGGVVDAVRTGDVVVATELRGPNGVRPCPSAPLVAADLRRRGLPVITGPVLSTDHVVNSAERAALADQGVVAVDMESAWLADRAPRTALTVVRVVADDARRPVLRPATLGRLRTALLRLPELGPTLRSWSTALGARQVLLAGPRSYCAGVVRAIDIVDRALDQRGSPVYVRKEIVHNRHVVDRLRERGAVFVDELDEVPDGASVVFSAHGVAPTVRHEASSRHLAVIDGTCPLVSKVHAELRRFADDGRTVLFIGHADHEETVGTMGERPDDAILVSDVHSARTVQVPDQRRVSYLVQTTLAADEVAEIVGVLSERFPALRGPASDDICYATTNRQAALRAIASEADVCLVVGSTNSSNTQRLVELSERLGTPAHLVDDADGVDLHWLRGVGTVAVTAGASAPDTLVEEIITAIGGLGPIVVQQRDITHETITFTLPKEVRRS